MSLRLRDDWIWDFWTAADGDETHLFYLHAPRSLGDPDLRHFAATVGHAVSRDLRTWHLLPEALGPGDPGAFDDRAIWTGSVMRRKDQWLMFYVGLSHHDPGPVQRIGMVVSNDLMTWERTGVRIEADARWYEKACEGRADEHWRDPWAFETPDGTVHLLITARAAFGPPEERGVIGHAWSRDLVDWTVDPPLSQPGEFRQLEVPQLVHVDGRWLLLASIDPLDHSASRRAAPDFRPMGGTLLVPADSPLGPFRVDEATMLLGDTRRSTYAGRLVPVLGTWKLLVWIDVDAEGQFVGELSDPMDVHMTPTGQLEVEVPPGVLETGR